MTSHLNSTLRVAVAHHEPLIAAGIVQMLSEQADIHVRSAAACTTLCLGDADVAIVGHQTALRLMEASRNQPHPALVVMSREFHEGDPRVALRAGVRGYLTTRCPATELLDAVRCAAQGRSFLSRATAERIADSLAHDALTAREMVVLRSISAGLCNKSIASELGMAVGTVKTHVRSILGKLDATTRTEAMAIAMQRHLV
jgi:DNA-binding NarL/FixJ family response regulator